MKRCLPTMEAGIMEKNSIIQPEQTIRMFPAEHMKIVAKRETYTAYGHHEIVYFCPPDFQV